RVRPDAAGDGGGGDGEAPASLAVGDRDPVAEAEPRRVRHGDLPLVTIAVRRQPAPQAIAGGQDGLARYADHLDVVTQGEGVAHVVAAGPDAHRAAAQAGEVIDRGLQGPVVAATDVSLVDPDPDLRRLAGGGRRWAGGVAAAQEH